MNCTMCGFPVPALDRRARNSMHGACADRAELVRETAPRQCSGCGEFARLDAQGRCQWCRRRAIETAEHEAEKALRGRKAPRPPHGGGEAA